MEGFLMVPPDRGTIIGRALWKARYVVLGSAPRDAPPPSANYSSNSISSASGLQRSIRDLPPISPPSQRLPRDHLYLTIYKAKDDWEPIQQFLVNYISLCEVKDIAHRKQGPVLPTLVITILPDPQTEKLRKRRSSRSGGLGSSKDTGPMVLWFRSCADDRFNIWDWNATIQSILKMPSNLTELQPLSPSSPISPTFSNPFSPKPVPRDAQVRDFSSMAPLSNQGYRAGPSSRGMNQPSALAHIASPSIRGDHPIALASPSPSLRSRRSDLSSQASSNQPKNFSYTYSQNYSSALSSDLPSPISPIEYEEHSVDGWTTARHGRTSALSNHTKGSNSIASAAAIPLSPTSSSPPGPRETILDRAFQMRIIPGADRDAAEDPISSLAKFDALMRKADEKKRQIDEETKKENDALRSAWDSDEESEEEVESSSGDDEDGTDGEDHVTMPTPAQRALDYISGRAQQHPLASRYIPSPPPRSLHAFHAESLNALASGPIGLRPRTGYGDRSSTMAPRTGSHPSLPHLQKRLSMDVETPTNTRFGDDAFRFKEKENRNSISSAKSLTFSDFTKKVVHSSTSSLLLVQGNTSSNSSRSSREVDTQIGNSLRNSTGGLRRGNSYIETRTVDRDSLSKDKRCSWRGSVGLFGTTEGGFL